MNKFYKYFLVVVFSIFIVFLIQQPAYSKNKVNSVELALKCENSGKCPYFFNLFEDNSDFRQSFIDTVQLAGITIPNWVSSGTSDPTITVVIDNKKIIFANICEPHNCPHQFILSYEPESKIIFGMYKPDNDEMNPIWFGQQNDKIKKALLDLTNNSSPISILISTAKKGIHLPIKWEFFENQQPVLTSKIEKNNSLSSGCDAISVLAENIMAARQYGFSMSKSMNLGITGNNDADKITKALIVAAYEIPKYGSHEMQLKSTEEFRDTAYLMCVKSATK